VVIHAEAQARHTRPETVRLTARLIIEEAPKTVTAEAVDRDSHARGANRRELVSRRSPRL
jgi:hypothetical protein